MNPETTRSKAEHKLQESLISGANCRNFYDHIDLIHGVSPLTSPTVPNESFPKQGMQLFRTLFTLGDKVCAGAGVGRTEKVDAWNWSFGTNKTEKGAYFKVNRLISDEPSGRKGGWCDKDCDTQLMMIEIDSGPKEDQLLLWAAAVSLGFPVVSLVDSGGKSFHAIIRVACASAAAYKKMGAAVLALFAPFIPDPTSVNASRFTRLPGVMRGVGDAARKQDLIYLNPDAPVWDGTGPFADEMAASMRNGLAVSFDGWVDDDLVFVQPWGFDLAAITKPVFLWQGDDDFMVPHAHSYWLEKHIPTSLLTFTPGEGHISLGVNHQSAILAQAEALLQ